MERPKDKPTKAKRKPKKTLEQTVREQEKPEKSARLDISEHDWPALTKLGELTKMKLPLLKEYCRMHKLSLSGNKLDIIQRIECYVFKIDEDGDEIMEKVGMEL